MSESSLARGAFRSAIWLLFGYEAWLNFVVPQESGYTTLHLVGYVALLLILAILAVSGVRLLLSGAANAFPRSVRVTWALLVLWGIYSGLRVFDWGDFRDAAYAWVTPWASGIWLVPIAALWGAAASVRSDFERQLTLETIFASVLMGAGYFADFGRALNANYSDLNVLGVSGLVLLFSEKKAPARLSLAVAAFTLFAVGQFLLGLRNGMLRVLFYVVALGVLLVPRFFQERTGPLRVALLLGLTVGAAWTAQRQVTADERAVELAQQAFMKMVGGYNSREALIRELRSDLSAKEWLLGSDSGQYWSEELKAMRGNVEGGYLELSMRGGLLYVVLFAATVLPPMIRGLQWPVGSPLWLLGLYIFERLVWMVTYGNPVVDLGYVTFWIAVGACASVQRDQRGAEGRALV